jgi:hypothetical protein
VLWTTLRPIASRRWEWERYGFGPLVSVSRLQEVSGVTCLAFPEESVLLHVAHKRHIEQRLTAVVAIPSGGVSEFLGQVILSRWPTSDTERHVHNEPYAEIDRCRNLWKPDSARRFLSGWTVYGDHRAVWSWLIDLDDPDQALFYLVYWDKGPGNAQAGAAHFREEAAERPRHEGDRGKAPPADIKRP